MPSLYQLVSRSRDLVLCTNHAFVIFKPCPTQCIPQWPQNMNIWRRGGGGTVQPNLATASWVRRLVWGRSLSCSINMSHGFLLNRTVSVFAGVWCTRPNWLSRLWPSHPPESLHQFPKRRWSWAFRRKELSWTPFFLVIADDATRLPFRLRLIMVSPGFVTCDDSGPKGLPPPQHQNATTFQNRWLSFDVCVRLWDFEEPIFAHTVEYPKASIIAIALSITGWKLYGQLPTCDAPMRLNNAIGALQHVWVGGCGRTPRPRSIMQLRSPLPEALTLWIQRPTVLLSTEQLPYTAHNRLWMFPTLYFPATKNSITARCLWRVSETNAIFTDYYSGAICRTTVYLHTCGQ